MVVLSLFDGMSCGQQALNRGGHTVNTYYASEIDKHAITVTMKNFPNTIQLGSVVDVDVTKLERIDLLIGGSPCQSFSFAGKRKGMSTKDEQEIHTLEHYSQLKSEGFEFEGQSYLFWEYMRILTDIRKINPDVQFLLENVMMGEKWEKILTKAIGVNPIEINSALVSAQNRRRLYWTNIGMKPTGLFGDLESIIEQPKARGILLKDILESEVDAKYFLSEKMISGMVSHTQIMKEKGNGFEFNPTDGNNKGKSLTTRNGSRPDDNYIVHNTMPRSSTTGKGGTGHLSRTDGKTYCLDTGNTNAVEIPFCVEMRGRNPENPKSRVAGLETEQQLEPRHDGKTNCLTSVQKDNLVAIMLGRSKGWGNPEKEDGKAYTLCKEQSHGISPDSMIRRLTPTECERLQTVDDGYTEGVSDTQRYRMLGNGWTVEVIKHIFSYL